MLDNESRERERRRGTGPLVFPLVAALLRTRRPVELLWTGSRLAALSY
jgi:hypothetical protein